MVNDLILEKTYSTPKVNFTGKNGFLKIEGRSIPENPSAFFEPLMDWISKYFESPAKDTICDVKLDYINSGSSKSILAILKLLKEYSEKGFKVTINWHYEEDDESIRDLGKHYKTILNMAFNLVETIA